MEVKRKEYVESTCGRDERGGGKGQTIIKEELEKGFLSQNHPSMILGKIYFSVEV